MSMEYDAESRTMVLKGRDGNVKILSVLLLNRCTCGAILRAYLELPSTSGLNLEDYLDWREADRYEVRKQGKHIVLFPQAYQEHKVRCCPREKHLAYALEPVVERWLKRRGVEPETKVVAQVCATLQTQGVPGFALIRDEMTGHAMGFTWLERAVCGGDRYWSGQVCAMCCEPVYAGETVCRACGSTELTQVETETWEQYEVRRKKGWAALWRTLGLPNPEAGR